jgi:small subunit ribosomal protein S17
MSEEEKNEETTEEPAAEAPAEEPAAEQGEADPAAPGGEAEEAPEAEQGEADPAAPGGEAEEADGSGSAEEADGTDSVEEAPAKEATPEEEPAEVLHPKTLRKQRRSQAPAEAGPPRSPEDRASERADLRASRAAARRRYRGGRGRRSGGEGNGTPRAEHASGPKKVRLGKVVSTKADKTITVQVEVARRHPSYEKIVRRSNTLHAHDERNEAQQGDTVRIVETRPLSRTKRWRLLEIVEKAR